MQRWGVVTPVYEDRECFAELCSRLAKLDLGVELSVFAVDDGSLNAAPLAEDIADAGLSGEVVRLSRNLGHQFALAVGLTRADQADLDGCILMDSDGEDAPGSIMLLLSAVSPENIDAAVARRTKRSERILFRIFYWLYRQFFWILTGQSIHFGNFMALKRRALRRLVAMQETQIHVAGALVKARIARADVPVERANRYFGHSRMSFVSLVLHGMRAVIVFSDRVLVRLTILFALMSLIAAGAIVAAIFLKVFGMATPGWLTAVLGFSMLMFLQTGMFAMVALLMHGAMRPDGSQTLLSRVHEFVDIVESVHGRVTWPATRGR